MKLTLLTPALAAVLGCALACAPVTASAQTNTSTSPSPAPVTSTTSTSSSSSSTTTKDKPDYTQYKGTITAMDATSVTVKNSKGEMKLTTDASTLYAINKKKAAMTDFAVGDKVTGSYVKGDDGMMTAHSVHKKAAK